MGRYTEQDISRAKLAINRVMVRSDGKKDGPCDLLLAMLHRLAAGIDTPPGERR